MGDNTTVRILVGGKITPDQAAELVRICQAEGVGPEFGITELTLEHVLEAAAKGECLDLGDHDVNYGNFEELDPWLQTTDLVWKKTWDRGGCYGAGGTLRDADGEVDFSQDGDTELPCLPCQLIVSLPLGDLVELCHRLIIPIPAIEIVDATEPKETL